MAKPDRFSVSRLQQLPILKSVAKPGQTSFRRILLSRILLISVPVLLMGQYVTYRKAASSLQETARQTLPDSAVRKAEKIRESIEGLQANAIAAAQTSVLQSGSKELAREFLSVLARELPTNIQCIQLADLQTKQIVASTCGEQSIVSLADNSWPDRQERPILDSSSVRIVGLNPKPKSPLDTPTEPEASEGQIQLIFSAPVYDRNSTLRYALSLQSVLYPQGFDRAGSLSGSTIVIDQDGTILLHPDADRVGRNIEQEKDVERLKTILKIAKPGEPPSFLHLFAVEKPGVESVAGYTAIPNPIAGNPNQKWVVLAVTRRDNALYNLREILQVLLLLSLGLIGASTVASLYLARDLARPLERLRDYALNLQSYHSKDRVPKNFTIREFNQLSDALKNMVERLKAWAQELETAWKEAQAANQLKSEFLANTSHELRTPLNAIIGCIRLVKDGCCDDREEETEFLQRADDAAIHLLNIINDILDLSKIESGTFAVVMERLDLRLLLKEVVDLQLVHINQKGLQLEWSPSPEPIFVHADPAKLKQVLINIVGNAIKFTDSGTIDITSQLKASPEKNGGDISEAIVSVRDTGIGVAPEQLQKLFRPFVMADGTRTRKHGGTGLGLAISRKLMELMNGSITLNSDGLGLGTTVEIILPIIHSSRLSNKTFESSQDIAEVASIDN